MARTALNLPGPGLARLTALSRAALRRFEPVRFEAP